MRVISKMPSICILEATQLKIRIQTGKNEGRGKRAKQPTHVYGEWLMLKVMMERKESKNSNAASKDDKSSPRN